MIIIILLLFFLFMKFTLGLDDLTIAIMIAI